MTEELQRRMQKVFFLSLMMQLTVWICFLLPEITFFLNVCLSLSAWLCVCVCIATGGKQLPKGPVVSLPAVEGTVTVCLLAINWFVSSALLKHLAEAFNPSLPISDTHELSEFLFCIGLYCYKDYPTYWSLLQNDHVKTPKIGFCVVQTFSQSDTPFYSTLESFMRIKPVSTRTLLCSQS